MEKTKIGRHCQIKYINRQINSKRRIKLGKDHQVKSKNCQILTKTGGYGWQIK